MTRNEMLRSGFVIDKITNSIEERTTGRRLETNVQLVSAEDIKQIRKKDGWLFNWKKEYKTSARQIYKLLAMEEDSRIQGLISIEVLPDERYIEMHLIESAPHNLGSRKEYLGVPANMVAFICKMSFDLGLEGFVAFWAKTKLVNHYQKTLGARLLTRTNRMGIFTEEARILVNSYYKNYPYG